MFLVTHTDLDGVGCEIVARSFYPQLTADRVFHCDYWMVDDKVRYLLENTEDLILISDISVNAKTSAWIDKRYRGRVHIYDHHQTAWEYLNQYEWSTFDLNSSATQVLFDSLSKAKLKHRAPMGLPMFVFYVNDYDMWHHTMPYSSELNDLLSLLDRKVFVEIMLDRLQAGEALINEHDKIYLRALEERKQKYIKQCLDRATLVENRLVILANSYTSELSEYIRNIKNPPKSWKNLKYIEMINLERGSHSLRSYDPEFDVSLIAKANGGGGHKKAAGFSSKKINIHDILLD